MSTVADDKRPAFGLPGRIQAPNSKPRTIALVGLGENGAAIARRVSSQDHANLQVHVLNNAGPGAVAAIQAGGGDLQRDLQNADMIFIVCARGDDAGLAPVVSSIAHSRNHSVTALYIVPAEQLASAEGDETLRTLRKSVEMLVVVSDESYVPAMVAALGS